MLKRRGGWVARYTAMYLCAMLPLLLCLKLTGATLFWGPDAGLQQYPTMRYVHDLLRGLLSGQGFPMVNLSLGQGLDTVATLAYYGLTDPMQWPAALFDGAGIELYYHFLIFLYIYLSGLLFGIYARRVRLVRGGDAWLTALAALVFATCGYQTIGVIKNPYYAAGSIYLLLLLIAAERVLRERRWLMMSLAAALMVCANFYLAYQTALLAALYCLIRLIARGRERGLRGSLADGLRLLGSFLLGLAMSAAVLFPVAHGFLTSSRADAPGGYTASLLHYPLTYYLKLLTLFCAPYDYAGYWSLQSFSPLALFGVALLFSPGERRPEEPGAVRGQLRAGLVLLLICLCVPLAGKVFNGFGYVTNRWCYGWAAAVCMAAAWGLPALVDPEYRGRARLALLGCALGAVTLVYGFFASRLPEMNGAGNATTASGMGFDTKFMAALAGALALFAASGCLLLMERRLRRNPRGARRLLALAGAACCMAYTVGYGFAAAFSGEFYHTSVEAEARNAVEGTASLLERDSFYRVDAGMVNDDQAGMLGYRGTSYYWSMIPAWVSDSYAGLELSTLRWTFRLYGLDGDSYLSALASVGVALRPNSEAAAALPCDFTPAEAQPRDGVTVYENPRALPLGYAFFEVMPEEEYAALDPVRKREALLSAAVLGAGGEGLPEFSGELPCEELDWEAVDLNGVELGDGSLRADRGGSLRLTFEARPDSEIYLRIAAPRVTAAEDDTDLPVATQCAAGRGRMYFIRGDGVFNYDQTGVCHRLGWSGEGLTACDLGFGMAGEIEFDGIELLSVPAGFYRDAVEKLRECGWEPEIGTNRVRGAMDMPREGILQISLPWSAGWSATVDGAPAELLRCGGMYMGLRLGAGAHEIELNYVTPGLIPGAWVSLGALVLAALLCARERLRGR